MSHAKGIDMVNSSPEDTPESLRAAQHPQSSKDTADDRLDTSKPKTCPYCGFYDCECRP